MKRAEFAEAGMSFVLFCVVNGYHVLCCFVLCHS